MVMEHHRYRKFVSVDPGSTTGLVSVNLLSGEYDEMREEEALAAGLENGDVIAEEVDTERFWLPDLADKVMEFGKAGRGTWTELPVVIEDFILRTRDSRRKTLDPIRVTSSMLAILWDRGWRGQVFYQQPADAKGIATNERLREWGLWLVGMAHGRDAMRHAVVFLRKTS